jgi:TldD protein
MKIRIDRREFLRKSGEGIVWIGVPALAAGCAAGTPPETRTALSAAAPPASKPAAAGAGDPGRRAGASATAFDAFGVGGELLRKTIARGLSRGGDFCEVYLQHSVTHTIGLEDGQVNRASTTIDLGAGIRVLKGESTGFAYCEDLGERALLETAATAAGVADLGGRVPKARPLVRVKVPSSYTVDVPWTRVAIGEKLPIATRAERTARARDSRIAKVTVGLQDETTRTLVATSEGLLVEDDRPMALLWVLCVAEQKGRTEVSSQSGSSRDGKRFFEERTVDRIATEAADYTVLLFDATTAPVGQLPVVLAPGIPGILLHEAIGHGMEADFNRKGISIYAGRIGQRIAPREVTIVDAGEGRLRGSLDVDDEGAATESTTLVEGGVLKTYLHDRISSKHYGLKGTGSGRRQSFRFPPVPRMRNTYMKNGPHKPEEIIASVEKGLYAELFSNGQVFIGAGDFTFYLKHGRLIEKGKLTRVVKDANLIGNGPKVLETVSMVGDDLQVFSGGGYCGKDGQTVPVGFGLPTIKATGMSIGGRRA